MTESSENISALIPAAGSSGRMGMSKLFLPFGNQKTFAEELSERFITYGCRKIVLVVNPSDFAALKTREIRFSPEVQVVINDKPDLGRFRSVRLGLSHLESGTSCFLQNIDNPFAGNEVLSALQTNVRADSVIVPVFEGRRGHPALLGKDVWPLLLLQNDDNTILRNELMKFTTIETAVNNPAVLVNINSPEEYQKYFGKTLSIENH